jgi:hypothetical protein
MVRRSGKVGEMRRGLVVTGIWLSSACALLVGADRAAAALGGAPESVESDRRALAAAARPTVRGSTYAVHELQSGLVRIREYVSPAGVVFGVAWNGPTPPDLDQLLGGYAAEWKQAAKASAPSPGRGFRAVSGPNVTVVRWGRMGNLRGRAWASALVPEGVAVDEIQ